MYPQYWTTSIGGIIMGNNKYSDEYKLRCIEEYRQGKWPETPAGKKERAFHVTVRKWARIEEACGAEALRHKSQNKVWSPAEKYELVAKVLAGSSYKSTAYNAGIQDGILRRWVKTYTIKGYEGLAAQRKGRPPKESVMRKKSIPQELTPSEREEMVRLKAENEYLRTENAAIKKETALRYARWDEQLKAKKQHSSKNSTKKDTN